METFDDIFGQDRAVEAIRAAYRADRLPHGLIFAGPAGVGKGTTARVLGALFLCEKAKAETACGKCESCRVFNAGNHPDYHVIYRKLVRLEKKDAKPRDLSIEVVREFFIAQAGRMSVVGVGKVFVVEEAERMTTSAQNALLKTLEEPYGRTLIVLLTDRPGALLPTILSRCQVVRFAALPEALVRRELEKRGAEKATAAEAARLSAGSLGIGLRWIEDGVVAAAGELTGRMDSLAAGRATDDLAGLLKRSADAYAEKQLERDKQDSKDQATREGLSLYLRIAAEHVRKQMAASDDPDVVEQACATIDAIARAETYLDDNVNVALALQQLAVTLERNQLQKAER